MIWLQFFLEELGHPQKDNYLFTYIQSAIHLAKNSALHSKTKHIQLRYHFIWSVLEDGQLKLEKIHTNDNLADMLTKVVTTEKLNSSSALVGLLDRTCIQEQQNLVWFDPVGAPWSSGLATGSVSKWEIVV